MLFSSCGCGCGVWKRKIHHEVMDGGVEILRYS